MDLLESPLEALVAFRYYSAAAAPLWAWLAAALTAALGLWRIRVLGLGSGSASRSDPPPKPTPPAAPALAPLGEKPTPVLTASPCHVEDIGTPKARFTVYYSRDDESAQADDGRGESDEDGHNGESDGVKDVGVGELTASWWDVTGVRRRGDLGWYRHQDLTALNGSVVRLWDGGLTASRRRTSRSRLAW